MATAADVASWTETEAGRAIGLRLPDEPVNTVGIDVDAYDHKHGGATWMTLCHQFGEPPVTWVSTARDDILSGIRFYRIPVGLMVVPAQLGPDVDVIHHGYRFARVWPSSHPSGSLYRWVDLDGRISDGRVPVAAELPELPESWLPMLGHGTTGTDENDSTSWSVSEAYLRPDIRILRRDGIPLGRNQDVTLSQVVFDLIRLGATEDETARIWIEIVNNTQQTRPDQPFTREDFYRHYWPAKRKLGATAIQPGQRAWAAGRLAGAVTEAVTPVVLLQQRPAEMADGTGTGAGEIQPAGAGELDRLTEALLIRDDGGAIRLGDTHEYLPRSDMSVADFIISQYPRIFTFSTASRLWRLWDGTVHVKAEDGNVEYIVQQVARAYRKALRLIQARAVGQLMLGDEPLTEAQARDQYEAIWRKHRQYRDGLWNSPGQTRMLQQLERHLSVSEEKFDVTDSIIVAGNGVVSVTGHGAVLLPHDPDRLITKRLSRGVSWEDQAMAPSFTQFIETSVPDPEMRRYLQSQLGMALAGRPGKGFINLIGKTNSGKSTLMRALQNVLGSYAKSVSVETFLEGAGSAEFRLHELRGIRFAFAAEPAANRRLDTEIIKAVTGRDGQRTREPYGRFVEWKPCCLIIVASNQPQRFETSDTAMLNRIMPIAFSDRHDVDPDLDAKLRSEQAGILRWLIDGAVMGFGAQMPESMVVLREAMAIHVDDVLRYLSEKLEEGLLIKDDSVPAVQFASTGEVYGSYILWCASEGIRVAGKKTFSQRVGRLFPVVRSNGSRFQGLVISS
jgi:P4 family phage/plasmid primase-like protien